MVRYFALAALMMGAALLTPPAHADVLVLKDGRIIEREQMEAAPDGIKVHFENGVILVPEKSIEVAVLSNPPEPKNLSAEDKEKLASGLVPYEGKWIKPDDRDRRIAKLVQERREFVEKLRHHSLWRNRHQDKTRHFEFEYTVAPFVYEYYRDTMEAYYKEFAKTWRVKQPRDLGRLKVCFYTDREKFAQISGAGGGVLGYFRFVKPIELNFYYNRVDPDQTEQVMYHEANHYLQLLLDPEFNMPHFPSEAIAEYYGASKYDPKTKKITTGHILEGRLTEVKTDIAGGNVMPLEKMLTTPRMYQHYTWGWTLAHFLMNHKSYQKRFIKFVKGLVDDKKVKRTTSVAQMRTVEAPEVYRYFCECLKLKDGEDVAKLESEWHDYINNTLKTESTRGLELAASAASRVGRPIRAKRLFKEAIEAGSDNPLTYYRYGDLLEDDGKHAEAVKMFRKAIELEPLEASFYASLGRTLYREGQKEEGLKTMKLALELDPDDVWLEDAVKRYQKEIGN